MVVPQAAIDAIKWRVYTVGKDIQGSAQPVVEKKEYFCPFCKAEYTQMDVLDSASHQGFLCHRCGHVLTHDLDRNSTGHEQSTRLNNQLKFITEQLPKIDTVVIPDNTFEVAFSRARPVAREATHPSQDSVPVESVQSRVTVVRGMANTGPTSISVNISAMDGTEAEKLAEKARKEKAALQNALPSWMSNSTITGESFSGTNPVLPAVAKREDADAKDAGSHSFDAKEQSEMDDYFARLKKQAAEQAAGQTQARPDEDEDEDDDFEDVVSSAPPVTESPQAKRVRVEDTIVKVEARTEVKAEESDDDIEFEDV